MMNQRLTDDIIYFQYVGKNNPQYHTYPYQEIENDFVTVKYKDLDNLDEKYLGDFQENVQDSYNNNFYIVENGDTIEGIQLKFEISLNKLQTLNSLGSDVYPGQKLMLPQKAKSTPVQGPIKKKSGSFLGINLLDDIKENSVMSKNVPMIYMTFNDRVEGNLLVTSDVLYFNPKSNKYVLDQKIQGNLKYQMVLLLMEIYKVEAQDDTLCIYILSKKRKSPRSLKKLKFSNSKPQAKIHFQLSLSEESVAQRRSKVKELAQHINQQVNETLKNDDLSVGNQKSFSVLPFYETVEIVQKFKLLDYSQTLTQQQFNYILEFVPSIFKMDWQLCFSSFKHGSSMPTLFRNCEFKQPVLLVIRDTDDYIFGAYMDSLKKCNDFYGTGESFVFGGKDSLVVYKWTGLNKDFTYSNDDGIGIGCGEKYSIYIYPDLAKGNSYYSETYGNEQLSGEKDFEIYCIEAWIVE